MWLISNAANFPSNHELWAEKWIELNRILYQSLYTRNQDWLLFLGYTHMSRDMIDYQNSCHTISLHHLLRTVCLWRISKFNFTFSLKRFHRHYLHWHKLESTCPYRFEGIMSKVLPVWGPYRWSNLSISCMTTSTVEWFYVNSTNKELLSEFLVQLSKLFHRV